MSSIASGTSTYPREFFNWLWKLEAISQVQLLISWCFLEPGLSFDCFASVVSARKIEGKPTRNDEKEEERKIDDRVLSAGSLVKEKEIAILYATLALAGEKR